jgi:hypothetical protein
MEDRLRDLLREHPAPDEQAAEQRAREVVRRAFAQRDVTLGRHRRWRGPVAVAAALALVAAAFTPPGEAVTGWVRDAVQPGRDDAREALVSLPAPGHLLVNSAAGPWIVSQDGSKRLLGSYDEASWSPQGLFVIAIRGHELVALDPKGRVRWSLARSGRVHGARWSTDGFRIGYLVGSTLRVVAGDGTGDRLVARHVAVVPPVWRPGAAHELAFADRAGRIGLLATDSRKTLWRSGDVGVPAQLAWSSDGRRLLALGARGVRLFDSGGRLVSVLALPTGTHAVRAAFAPTGHAYALAARTDDGRRSRLTVVQPADGATSQRRLLTGAGRFSDLAWSPDGRWLLAAWPDADQWVFVRARSSGAARVEKLLAVANIRRQFDSGAAFPRLGGWCCP